MVVSVLRWMHPCRGYLTYSVQDLTLARRTFRRTHTVSSQLPSDKEMRLNSPPQSSTNRPIRLLNRVYLAKQEEKLKNAEIKTADKSTSTVSVKKEVAKEVAQSKVKSPKKVTSSGDNQMKDGSVSVSAMSGANKKKSKPNNAAEVATEPEKNRPFTLPPGIFR